MKKGLCVTIFIICFIIFLSSCGESFLLSNGNGNENGIEIISLSPGGVIEKGETLTFQVKAADEEEKPDKLEINLYTNYSDRIGKLENTTFALNEDLSLNLFDSLSTGEYTLEFILYMGSEVLCEEEITFFFTEEEFLLLGIESFPPVVFPGATVLLSGTLSIPDDEDPFLRWTVDNEVISSGLMSDGADKILWSVPEEEGVYTVKVELFPTPPDGTDDFPFSSEIFMDVELYVSESSKPPSRHLSPEDSYYFLYHFDGNLMDTAQGRYSEDLSEKKTEAVPIGNPQIITVEEDFGYYIDSYSGFRIDECILPVIDGKVTPLTLSIGLELDPAQNEKNIFISKTYDNLFSLTLAIDGESYVYAIIQSGSKEIIIPSNINIFAVEYRFLISLSIIPGKDSLTATWFFDGIQTNSLTFEDINIEITSDGETIIGGENGFAGVIDELGVYYIDENGRYTVNPSLYENAIHKLYGDNSILAEGFDGIYPPDSLNIEEGDSIENGRLILESSLSTAFSSINLDKELMIIVNFDSPLPKDGSISLSWRNADAPFLEVSTSGTFMIPEIKTPLSRGEGNPEQKPPVSLKNIEKSFHIIINDKGTKISFPGETIEEIKINPPPEESQEILLKINNNDNTPIIINSITVVKD